MDFVEHKMDTETGKRRGYGFIRFKSLDAQQQVLDRRDFVIGGRAVQVKIPYDRVSFAIIDIRGSNATNKIMAENADASITLWQCGCVVIAAELEKTLCRPHCT